MNINPIDKMAKAIEMNINSIDNMVTAIEATSMKEFVKDSEVMQSKEKSRRFEYELNDKAAKAKLVKGAKRLPFEVVDKSSSSNLVFNLGAWQKTVNPSVRYWDQVKGNKSCKVGDMIVTVASVTTGKETSGKHVDTQIVFYVDRDKVVCHFYNTTQLILVNGRGYKKN